MHEIKTIILQRNFSSLASKKRPIACNHNSPLFMKRINRKAIKYIKRCILPNRPQDSGILQKNYGSDSLFPCYLKPVPDRVLEILPYPGFQSIPSRRKWPTSPKYFVPAEYVLRPGSKAAFSCNTLHLDYTFSLYRNTAERSD
jgi:hypothetical protein